MSAPYARWAIPAPVQNRVRSWLSEASDRCVVQTERVPLEDVEGWSGQVGADEIRHDRGAFFSIVGISVSVPGAALPAWDQPIIHQPEVGVLGIVVQEHGGVLRCLMQVKAEPGTVGGAQLAPTVQATRSNYTRKHGGAEVPYLGFFVGDDAPPTWVDVLQSEQGARFRGKHNRNVVVHAAPQEASVSEGFEWFTLGELHCALRTGDLLNFDARTVLAGLAARIDGLDEVVHAGSPTEFAALVLRSLSSHVDAHHPMHDVVGWLYSVRQSAAAQVRVVPLASLEGWHRQDGVLRHESGGFFEVMGVRVVARGREVGAWSQPMLDEQGVGLLAFLVAPIGNVLHVLLQARVEPGLSSGAELAPTLQCTPESYARAPGMTWPPHLEAVLEAAPETVRFDNVLSAEGGRFYHARQRHLIVETEPFPDPPGFRWVAVHQLAALIRRGQLVNEQARSLFACLMSLSTTSDCQDGS